MFEMSLASAEPLLLDGGLATELEAQGHDIGTMLWSAELLSSNPQAIIDAHRAFLDAGARCIISASYQASREGFATLGLSAEAADKLIVRSVTLALTARDEYLRDRPGETVLVAASIGPYGAMRHDGSEYTGEYDASRDELQSFHRQRLELLDEAGADVLACETIPSVEEAEVIGELLLAASTPAWVSFSCRDAYRISDGTRISDVVARFSGHPQVMAVGINCTAPQHVTGLIREVKGILPDKAIVVYPNSGETYHADDNSWSGTASPIECGEAAATWHEAGAQIIGGCCRMGPKHILAMRESLGRSRGL